MPPLKRRKNGRDCARVTLVAGGGGGDDADDSASESDPGPPDSSRLPQRLHKSRTVEGDGGGERRPPASIAAGTPSTRRTKSATVEVKRGTTKNETRRTSLGGYGPWNSREVVENTQQELLLLQEKLDNEAKRHRREIEESQLGVSSGDDFSRAKEGPKPACIDPTKGGHDDELGRGGRAAPPSPEDDEDGGKLVPWNGRLGYACLNTYLRTADPPVFSSRTTRISTILQRSHPCADPTRPFHARDNPADPSKPLDRALGRAYLQSVGLGNARDVAPMIRWNVHFGIHFMRLSSQMFPFASHETYGYGLNFARDALREAGRTAAALDHRVTTHPGQYTQLGSPRDEVVRASVRDLAYHDEMLTLMELPAQLDSDAVVIIHMGGAYGDKAATMKRFADNYAKLSPSVRRRLVLENDDVSYSVHDLLPLCEGLSIPLVLDWHHHTIVHDVAAGMRGTEVELLPVLPRIAALWRKKGITQKMHYSEPCADAFTPRDRRRHSARVQRLPLWRSEDRVDLVIEAKDKEQAVFELMRKFNKSGRSSWTDVAEIVPHERADRRWGALESGLVKVEEEDAEGFDLGGRERRVYWPAGKEAWLKPRRRGRKRKESGEDEGSDVESSQS